MSDIVNVTSVDVQKTSGTAPYYIPDGSASTMVDDLRVLLTACQDSDIQLVTQEETRFLDLSGAGISGETPFVSQAAALLFDCDDASQFTVYVLAPIDGTFHIDGSVNDTQPWIADLIAFLLANGQRDTGAGFTGYVSGEFVELQPGFLDINGAASMSRHSGLVADFNPQDGADIKVSGV